MLKKTLSGGLYNIHILTLGKVVSQLQKGPFPLHTRTREKLYNFSLGLISFSSISAKILTSLTGYFFNLQVKYSNAKMGAIRTAYVGIFLLFLSCDFKKKLGLFPSISHSWNQKSKSMCIKRLKNHLIIPRCSKGPI